MGEGENKVYQTDMNVDLEGSMSSSRMFWSSLILQQSLVHQAPISTHRQLIRQQKGKNNIIIGD